MGRTTQLAPPIGFVPPPGHVDNWPFKNIVAHYYQGFNRSPVERMLDARTLAELVRNERSIGILKHSKTASDTINRIQKFVRLSKNDRAIADKIIVDLLDALGTLLP